MSNSRTATSRYRPSSTFCLHAGFTALLIPQLHNIEIDESAVNAVLIGLPCHVSSGSLGFLRLCCPLSELFKEDVHLRLDHLDIHLRPASPSSREPANSGGKLPRSPNFRESDGAGEPEEGLQMLSRCIKHITSHIRVEVRDLRITFDTEAGTSVEIHVPRLEFRDSTLEFYNIPSSDVAGSHRALQDFSFQKKVGTLSRASLLWMTPEASCALGGDIRSPVGGL